MSPPVASVTSGGTGRAGRASRARCAPRARGSAQAVAVGGREVGDVKRAVLDLGRRYGVAFELRGPTLLRATPAA